MLCSTQKRSETEEHLQIAAVVEGNHTYVADEIDWCVLQMDCQCWSQFVNL